MTHTEFWEMHPEMYWWLAEVNRPQRMYGNMTEAEVKEIYDETYGDEDESNG